MSTMTIIKALTEKAIESSLTQNWQQAVDYNQQILAYNQNDISTLNRLAKAYKELGLSEKAAAMYQQVLCLDRYNLIAKKYLEQVGSHSLSTQPCSERKLNTDFIEEPGKTHSFNLIRLGDSKLISTLQPGQIVCLAVKKHTINITTTDGHHLGALTDDVAFRLKKFLDAGNTYTTTIKTCSTHSITVFIRETSRSVSLNNTPTFN